MMRLLNTKRLGLFGLSLFLVATTPVFGQTPSPATASAPNPAPKSRHRFLVSAHRGNHTHAPENTLQAYANAIGAGADYVEIDLRTTRDSVLVIMHDVSVNRMTTGKGIRALQTDHPGDLVAWLKDKRLR